MPPASYLHPRARATARQNKNPQLKNCTQHSKPRGAASIRATQRTRALELLPLRLAKTRTQRSGHLQEKHQEYSQCILHGDQLHPRVNQPRAGTHHTGTPPPKLLCSSPMHPSPAAAYKRHGGTLLPSLLIFAFNPRTDQHSTNRCVRCPHSATIPIIPPPRKNSGDRPVFYVENCPADRSKSLTTPRSFRDAWLIDGQM